MPKARLQVAWRRALMVGLVAVIIAAFAGLFISLASNAHQASHLADDAPTPTSTLAPTSTPRPTATATAIPTATPSPTPVFVAPTATPPPPMGPFFAPMPNGSDVSTAIINSHCPTSEQLDWQAVIQMTMKPNDTILWHWVHYDGAAPGQPADATFTAYEPTPEYPWVVPPSATNPVRIGADDTWNITSIDMTGSTARWGDQLVIDAVDGQPLATPMATAVFYLATGC